MKNIEIVCFGEVLWDNLKEGRRLGGAPLNVCYHLNKRGIPSAIVSQVGNDSNGNDILREIDQLEIDRSFCTVSDSKPTSTVEVHITDEKVTYEIVEDVAWDHIPYTSELENTVAGAEVLLFGSLVTRNSVSRNTLFKLLPAAKYKVFDVNMRPPFYTKDRIEALVKVSNLLKMNEEELSVLCDWWQIAAKEEYGKLNTILHQFGSLEAIVLTKGAEGASYCSRDLYLSAPAQKVQIADTVGSGDAFLASFLASKLQGVPVEEALKNAIVLSGFVATQAGACPPYELAEIY